MPRALVIRPQAQADVDEHAAYYQANENLLAATRFLEDTRHVFERLIRFPHIGTPWPTTNPELDGLRRRALPHFPYSVFYLPTSTTIEVVRVLHHRQDFPPLLENL